MPCSHFDSANTAVLSEDAQQICFLVRCLDELRSEDPRSSLSDRRKMQFKLDRLDTLICTKINQLQGNNHNGS